MTRRRRQLFPRGKSTLIIATVTLIALTTLAAAGCGSKSGISRDQFAQVQKGMTLDQVEGLLGQPDRTHHLGTSKNLNIIWYYNKSESDGLVRVSFLDGKVDSTTPYDTNVTPEE